MIGDVLYSEDFKKTIKFYLHVDIETDWIGRLYGVINPNIDINGNLDLSNTILEIDGENTNNNEQVKSWIYKQLKLVGELFKLKDLYNFISLEFKHVGPINGDNYLIVFDMSSRQEFAYYTKKLIKQLFLYSIIICIAIVVIS